MADAVELLGAVKKRYSTGKTNSKTLIRISERIEKGKAGFEDADQYAGELARVLIAAYDSILTAEITAEIADKVIRPTIEQLYLDAAEAAGRVQEAVHKKSGFRIKAVTPMLDKDRLDGLIERILGDEERDD